MSNINERVTNYITRELHKVAKNFSEGECKELLIAFEGMCAMDIDDTIELCDLPNHYMSYMRNNYTHLSARLQNMKKKEYVSLFQSLRLLSSVKRTTVSPQKKKVAPSIIKQVQRMSGIPATRKRTSK